MFKPKKPIKPKKITTPKKLPKTQPKAKTAVEILRSMDPLPVTKPKKTIEIIKR